jgi:serine/threonine protein kinase
MEKYQSLFMDVYIEGESLQLQKKEESLQKIHSWMDHLQKRHWKSRTKRCLKESSEFSVERERGIAYYHRRDFPLDILKEMAKEHRQSKLEKPSDLLKYSPKVTVSILGEWGKRISVKNYHPPKVWDRFKEHFRRSKGMRAWISGNGLRVRGVPTLKPLGLEEKRDWLGLKESLFFMEVLEGAQELDRYILNSLKDFKERRLFIKVFAQWLSHCHHKDLYHRDMKTCNILVSKEGESWHFYLLDLEDVRLDKKVHERDLFKNFLQLNTSTPKMITTTDRFRFFRDYIGFCRIIKNEKIFLKGLMGESKRRGIVYVAPWGVVIDKM